MPLSYIIKDGIVFTTGFGEITPAEQNSFTRTWLADPNLPSPLLVCRDNRDLQNTTSETLREIAMFSNTIDVPEGSRLALLVVEQLAIGQARVYQAYTDNPKFEVSVFLKKDEAIQWLLH